MPTTFRPLFFAKDMLRDYSIDITDSDDYDFLFVGMHDFLNKKIPLKESIDYGLEIKIDSDNNYNGWTYEFSHDNADEKVRNPISIVIESNEIKETTDDVLKTKMEDKKQYRCAADNDCKVITYKIVVILKHLQ